MKKAFFVIALIATSRMVTAVEAPHVPGEHEVKVSGESVTVTKVHPVTKVSKTTYVGKDAWVPQGVTKMTTLKKGQKEIASKTTSVINTTGTGDGAANGAPTVTKFTTVTGPNGESKSFSKSTTAERDLDVSQGLIKTTTVTGANGQTVTKTTRLINTTGTGDGAANGAPTVTKFTTVTGPEGNSVNTPSKSISK